MAIGRNVVRALEVRNHSEQALGRFLNGLRWPAAGRILGTVAGLRIRVVSRHLRGRLRGLALLGCRRGRRLRTHIGRETPNRNNAYAYRSQT